jgi:hypothetical protein
MTARCHRPSPWLSFEKETTLPLFDPKGLPGEASQLITSFQRRQYTRSMRSQFIASLPFSSRQARRSKARRRHYTGTHHKQMGSAFATLFTLATGDSLDRSTVCDENHNGSNPPGPDAGCAGSGNRCGVSGTGMPWAGLPPTRYPVPRTVWISPRRNLRLAAASTLRRR